MPLYDFHCSVCDTVIERLVKYVDRENQHCASCDSILTPLVSNGRYIPFKSGYYEHFTDKPIYIGNKQQLKDACDKYNKGSVYLDDM